MKVPGCVTEVMGQHITYETGECFDVDARVE